MNIGVIGAGAWGTALADHLARLGHRTTLWAYERDVAEEISRAHRNSRYLADVSLAESIHATPVVAEAVDGAEMVVYVAPSHVLRAVARSSAASVLEDAILVVASKGIERDTFALMSDVVAAEVPGRSVVALSGPSFAIEVARGQPTAVVAACADAPAATSVQQACSGAAFRVYTNDDVVGVELGGSLKNVMAIAVGIADGLGLGYNTRAALITRGLAEMSRLGAALGARPSTFSGLAGVGDLVLTCTGPLSRNRAVGVAIGQGMSLAEAVEGKATVAEGVGTAASARALARHCEVDMPLVEAVHAILFEGYSARDALRGLMTRGLKGEHE